MDPSERLGVAVTMTRSCLGVWDLRAGALHSTFSRDKVGAKVTMMAEQDLQLSRCDVLTQY